MTHEQAEGLSNYEFGNQIDAEAREHFEAALLGDLVLSVGLNGRVEGVVTPADGLPPAVDDLARVLYPGDRFMRRKVIEQLTTWGILAEPDAEGGSYTLGEHGRELYGYLTWGAEPRKRAQMYKDALAEHEAGPGHVLAWEEAA